MKESTSTTGEPGSLAAGKEAVREFWQRESCGSRYLVGEDERQRLAEHARRRLELEPYIPEFAGFGSARGKKVLEIGVGLGADFVQWCRAGADATGVDLTPAAIEATQRRCELEDFHPALRVADAEALPFADGSFDIVYSWGALHHSPDTPRCVDEVWRVLKPGGTARIMIYGRPSWVAVMLWVRYALLRGRPWWSLYDVVFHHLESPGTKTYSDREARQLVSRFRDLRITRQLSPGDLLTNDPSEKYRSRIYGMIWWLYPRALVRALGNGMGLFCMIEATKPTTL